MHLITNPGIKTMLVELVYDGTCPNVAATRTHLFSAFSRLGIKPHWQEWEVNNPDTPANIKHYGSPTILVNGRDINGSSGPTVANNCRVYTNADSTISGVPPVEMIVTAVRLQDTEQYHGILSRHHGASFALFPAVGLALLPKLVCPLCWPLYSGLLGSIGLGFVNYTPYLLPFLLVFLAITNISLVVQSRRQKIYGPMLAGLFSSIAILTGKFLYESPVLGYAGITGLILAVIWQLWLVRTMEKFSCPSCIPETH
jgi:mercuric ion transport protein